MTPGEPAPAATATRPVADPRGSAVVALVRDQLAPLVDRFRAVQADDGSVTSGPVTSGSWTPSRPGEPERLLARIEQAGARVLAVLGQEGLRDALAADLADWRSAGLDSRPMFDRVRDTLEPAADGGLGFFLGPVLTTNGPDPVGHRLECFLTLREEPVECARVAERYRHPKNSCQSTRLLAGSAGLRTGSCIVFFPENVPGRTPVEQQRWASFFFNKFQPIYRLQTVPAARALLDGRGTGRADGWRSVDLAPADCYRARCVWGYLHDYFHHQGPRPFDQHMKVKLNWFVGLLEEIKVDAQTALACAGGGVPFGPEQVEFILLERMFRYPLHPAATRNFDAGTGVLLFSWLRAEGALRPAGDRFHLDWTRAVPALEHLVAEIEAIEVAAGDDSDYKRHATAFVRRFLPPGEPGRRYAMTPEQRRLAGSGRPGGVLDLSELPY